MRILFFQEIQANLFIHSFIHSFVLKTSPIISFFRKMISLEDLKLLLMYSYCAMIITGFVTIIACSVITAPYGKFTTEKGWGIPLPAKLTWMIMESPNLWMGILLYNVLNVSQLIETHGPLPYTNLPNQILYGMFVLHYINRSLIFPLFLAQGNPMPISVMLFAFSYCCWNGFNQAVSLLFTTTYPMDWLSSPLFLFGVVIFFLGMGINITADHHLLYLKAKAKKDGQGYLIPTAGFFQLVSSANYCKSP